MTKKITAIIMCAMVVLVSGMTVAYYNTKSFGFDENAKIVSRDNNKVSFLDFEIYYDDVELFFETAKQYLPDKTMVAFTYSGK